jgi:hypothetical protein
MTIREYLMQRSRLYVRRTRIFLLVAGALVCIATRGFAVRFACAVVIVVVAIAAFWSLFNVPCPKCRKPLGMVGFKVANSGMGSRTVPAQCVHCKVSFDEPLQPEP